MNKHFKNLRIGTRLLIITPLLGIERLVFGLPFDLFPLAVLFGCTISVVIEYKVISWLLHKQPNNLARRRLSLKFSHLGQQVMLAGLLFLIAAQFENTPEQVFAAARIGNMFYLSGLIFCTSNFLGFSRYMAHQAEWLEPTT